MRLSKIRRILFSFFLLVVICASANASFEDLGVGARSLSMGEAFVGLANSSDAVFLNPAGLARLHGLEASTFYSRPFGLKELAYTTATFAYPMNGYTPAIGIQTYGYSVYRENSFYFSLARQFQDRIFFGATMKYQSLSIKDYGTGGTLGIDLGIIVQANEIFAVGCTARNINRPQIGRNDENLPQVMAAGIMARPLLSLIFTFDIYKDIRFPIEARSGIEYQVIKNLFLRAGIATDPARHSLGFGLNLKGFQIHYAYYSHQYLSASHQISIAFSEIKNIKPKAEMVKKSNLSDFKKVPQKREKEIEPTISRPEEKEPEPQKTPKKKKSTSIPLKPGETININTADQQELCRLPGIGPKTADAIIQYRKENGQFIMLTELTKVKGIGLNTYKKLQTYIRLKD